MKKKSLLAIPVALLTAGACVGDGEKQAGNPFLASYGTPFEVPAFDRIEPQHYMPAFEAGIEEHRREIEAIALNASEPSFQNTIEAYEKSGRLLREVQNVLGNLVASRGDDDLRAIAVEMAGPESNHFDDILMDARLFSRIKSVYDRRAELGLDIAQTRLVESTYRDFVRGGALLSDEQKATMRGINEQMSTLSLQFRDNTIKDSESFRLVINNKEDLAGLPQGVIDAAAHAAAEAGLQGSWLVTLDNPSRLPFLQYSERRELREKVYKAYINKSDNGNQFDNNQIALQILRLRQQRAQLLGYPNHAMFVLEERMAKTPDEVYALCGQLMDRANAAARAERDELQKALSADIPGATLEAWDWWYYADKIRKARYDLDEEALRPYFAAEAVTQGVFTVSNKLYNITFQHRPDIPVYHPETQAYEVKYADGRTVGVLLMDLYTRPGKNSGAWMSSYRDQERDDAGNRLVPVITLNCNFPRPTPSTPSLLSFDDATTLFHEFGHALHGLLSDVRYRSQAGTSVPRDFVELPSQIMENWAGDPEVLRLYALHYQTGEAIPQPMLDRMQAAAKFNQGFNVSEFQAAALLDMYWHTLESYNGVEVKDFEAQIRQRTGLLPQIEYRYRTTFFNHIFASGYSAGYYSYTWAEILDADAFGAFRETSLFDQATAQRFLNLLQSGGSQDPMELYVKFRGRRPTIDALLQRKGI